MLYYIKQESGQVFFVSLKNRKNRVSTKRRIKCKFVAELTFLPANFAASTCYYYGAKR